MRRNKIARFVDTCNIQDTPDRPISKREFECLSATYQLSSIKHSVDKTNHTYMYKDERNKFTFHCKAVIKHSDAKKIEWSLYINFQINSFY